MKLHQQKTKCGIEKIHECLCCNKKFKRKATMKKHVRKIHHDIKIVKKLLI